MKKTPPKAALKPAAKARQALSRHQREQKLQRVLFAAAGLVLLLLLSIPVFGYWREFFYRPTEPIVRVHSQLINLAAYAKVLGWYAYQVEIRQAEALKWLREARASGDPAAQSPLFQTGPMAIYRRERQELDERTLLQLVEAELVRAEAQRRGIVASPEEVDEVLREEFGPPEEASEPTGSPTPTAGAPPSSPTPAATPTLTPQERLERAKGRLRAQLDAVRVLSEEEFRYWILEPAALRKKLQEALEAEVPTQAEQIRARHIQVLDLEKAQEVRRRLEGGEDFAALARELSVDGDTKDKGGELGWLPKGVMEPQFDEVAFALPPGRVSEPVRTADNNYSIIEALEQGERDIEPNRLAQLRARALGFWLGEQMRPEAKVVQFMYDAGKLKWAQDYLRRQWSSAPGRR